MVMRLRLSRDQLASFLKDHEQIKQFERLFGAVDDMANDDSVEIDISGALATINGLAGQLQSLIDTMGLEPPAVPYAASDDVTPPVQHNNSIVTDYIDLPEIGPHVTQARRVQWNSDDGTLDVGLYGGSVLQVGQETHYYVKNTSGATILNGAPVVVTGTLGASGKLTVGPAIGNGTVDQRYFIGAATQDIANNAFGYVTAFGLLRGFDTSAYADGDLLYVSATTAGQWTKTAPAAPNWRQPQAIVVYAGVNGTIFVRQTPEHSLGELRDVYVPGVSDKQYLRWDNAAGRWVAVSDGVFTTVTASTSVLSNGTGGIGYTAGSGGSVTQTTDKSTAVTLDKVTGRITMDAAALAAGATVSFTLNNSTIATHDMLILAHQGGGNYGSYNISARVSGAGTAIISVRNNTAGSLSDAILIKYSVFKSSLT